jgi:glutaryl-CoA dehydrogenase
VPEEYGGVGAGYVSYGLIAREIERVDSGYRSMMSVQSSLVMYPIYAYGSEEQRQKYLPKLATGEWIGCFGLTEPDAGSDPAGMKTRAEEDRRRLRADRREDVDLQRPDRRRLRGLGQVRAHDGKIRGFMSGEGHEGPPRAEDRGQAVAARLVTGEIVMDGVEVGEDALLPNVSGLKGPFGCLNRARYGIAWGVMGAAEACWHAARNTRWTASSSAARWRQTSCSRRSWPTCRPRSRLACRAACAWAA